MATVTQSVDSLFTLEIVVDRLMLSGIQCRFPAVAFRLLDYPTLMIYHVEPAVGDKIKASIKRDPLYKLGKHIPELVDKNGSFPIKKGKSCLLKIPPENLQKHLSSTPLYLMVVDIFPETPKLIGNCTIPLDETMNKVYEEILKVGLAIPIVQGERGCYKIYNLMGTQIGSVIIGIRILSLGVGLIPHIPSSAFLQRHDTVVTDASCEPTKTHNPDIQEKVADIVLEDFEKAEKQVETAKAVLMPMDNEHKNRDILRFQMPTQTDREVLQNIATQTEKQKRQRRVLDITSQIKDNVVDDIVVSNTVCPPPLFFNRDMDPKHKNHEQILDNIFYSSSKEKRECVSSDDDDDTIRHEDLSDQESGIETYVCKTSNSKSNRKPTVFKAQTENGIQHNLKDYPLLNAILQEIVSLTYGSQLPNSPKVINITSPKRGSSRSPTRSKSPSKGRGRSSSPRRERSSVENFVKRMQSPTHTVRELPVVKPTYDTSHPPTPRKPTHSRKCEKEAVGVPKTKSWIRDTPIPMEVKKTSLAYGLTNTQRLRLQKSNPEMLKSLERKEQERIQRFKEQRRREEETRPQPSKKLYTGERHRVPMFYKDHKRPVPTPRHSLKDSQDSFDQAHPLTTYQRLQEEYRFQYNMTPDIDVVAENEQKDTSENSQVKVSDYDPENGHDRQAAYGKQNPGFPVSGEAANIDQDNADDFEDPTESKYTSTKPQTDIRRNSDDIQVTALDPAEELGLRQYNEQYTDDEKSNHLNIMNTESDHVEVRALPDSSDTKTPSPKFSVQKPIAALRNKQVDTLRKSNVTVEGSVESTAYISRSQVFGNQSTDSEKSGLGLPKESTKSHRTRRNTESVSSYEGEDMTSQKSKSDYSDDSFNDSDEDDLSEYAVPEPLGMNELKISKEAKLGYTWT